MPDAQIHPTGTVSTPADYVIADSAEVRLKGVYAHFDGTGAAGAYLPTVRIISDAGTVVLETAADTSVAAGASADASWFPHLAAAPAAAASGPTFERAWGVNFGGQTVTAHTTANSSFTTVRTSDSTKIQWSTSSVLNDTFKIMTTGWALISASCQWPAGTLVDYRIDSPGGFELFQHDAITKFSGQGSDFTVGLPTMMDSVWIDSTAAAGTQFRLRMTNNDGADSGPDSAMVAIMFFPGLSV